VFSVPEKINVVPSGITMCRFNHQHQIRIAMGNPIIASAQQSDFKKSALKIFAALPVNTRWGARTWSAVIKLE
jgi:hypothetical protein